MGTNIFIELEFQQGFESLNGQWQVVECTEGELYLVSENNYISLNQNCELEDDFAVFNCFDDFELIECANPNGEAEFNLSADTIGLVNCTESFTPSFHNTLVDAQNNTNAISNTESYFSMQGIVYLRIEANSGNFQIFNIYLNTEECANFDCFVNTSLTECDDDLDGIATFNLTEANQECGPDIAIYGVYYFESESDAQNIINPIENPESYSNSMNPSTLFGAVINVNNYIVEHIFTIDLLVENCNYFECFESFDAILEVCDNGTDGPYEFDLTIAFANCTPSADIVTYHETQADAETGVNPIANPEAYLSTDVQGIVYVRVEINNQIEVFLIQLSIINCNSGDCTEGDIDGILTECLWNITSYNGSDNLISYNFDFEPNSEIVVIYNDEITIAAGWSTTQTNDGVVIDFSNVAGPNIQAINGSWLVVECTAEQLVLHNVNDSNNEIVLDRTCE